MRGDSGSGTVWAVALCALLWLAASAVFLTASARTDRNRAATAADLAALTAAADAVRGGACTRARATAEANGAELVSCAVTGLTVEVVVSLPSEIPGRHVRARARAGPVHAYPGP
ncbi:Rv3654c family TadE-like protein [Nocardiopsis sp. CNT312]|uniref:Rv3654c family TadE-like protein n=1 Tax=Nocardiopsis sp. CNT312 TaxID=1137268 RepID=UPI00048C0FA2|nr:Rv3654c family TadE-like protein [Nocardiopsis sp. CNT312]